MRTIVIINQKGGCGKTTTAINLAAGFAARSFRTLLIDMDPQSHCAAGLGVPESKIDLDIGAALLAPSDAPLVRERLVWHPARCLDLVPSTMMLAALESARGGLQDLPDKELRLRTVIHRLSQHHASVPEAEQTGGVESSRYDVCVIDCPPTIGLLSYNALAAAREVLIPVESSYFSLKGASKQIKTVRSIARRLGARIQPRLLATMHDPNQPLSRDVLDKLRGEFAEQVVPLPIRYDPELKVAAGMGRPIEHHKPEGVGAEDYRALCEWLIEHAAIDRPEDFEDIDTNTPPVVQSDRTEPGPEPALVGADQRTAEHDPERGGSRVAELVERTKTMRTGPVRRSLMPHRPIAIEVSDQRIVEPGPRRPAERVRHLLGVRPVSGGLLFVQPISAGAEIRIAGSFNGWDPEKTVMRANEELGIFEHLETLPEGDYQYKLVIDGQWVLDEHNPARVSGGLGSQNNAARVMH